MKTRMCHTSKVEDLLRSFLLDGGFLSLDRTTRKDFFWKRNGNPERALEILGPAAAGGGGGGWLYDLYFPFPLLLLS